MNNVPKTLVSEVMVPLKDALQLLAQDTWRDVSRKGLGRIPDATPVVIVEDAEVMMIATAKKLGGEILPRSWSGKLGDRVRHLPSPPMVMAGTQVVALGFLVQDAKADWLLVLDDQTEQPIGLLNSQAVMRYIPSDTTPPEEIKRSVRFRLWGTSGLNVYYYCDVEKRNYGPHMVRADAEGRMRDPKGHVVEKRTA